LLQYNFNSHIIFHNMPEHNKHMRIPAVTKYLFAFLSANIPSTLSWFIMCILGLTKISFSAGRLRHMGKQVYGKVRKMKLGNPST
jgi:hypothetical protein